MSPREAQRELDRALRGATRTELLRDIPEFERLARLSERLVDEADVATRRLIEHERLINPEFFVTLPEGS